MKGFLTLNGFSFFYAFHLRRPLRDFTIWLTVNGEQFTKWKNWNVPSLKKVDLIINREPYAVVPQPKSMPSMNRRWMHPLNSLRMLLTCTGCLDPFSTGLLTCKLGAEYQVSKYGFLRLLGRLQDWRCLWCRAMVHTACRPQYPVRCPLGPCRVSIVPPTALHSIGKHDYGRLAKKLSLICLYFSLCSRDGWSMGSGPAAGLFSLVGFCQFQIWRQSRC